ncbi:transcriptional regulator, XRE family [Kribbella flavida DSM 17836]|uniref:Transcriptional regulator, XRE family n=1 Tax=Kribbella flavida (strain DSM 17836 / JCM 10339 / NBRC 14399) TaxID=479435 RepID=D2Q1P0_KRIFD|nr:tetratricopeptide repeat protein [Kribbella flavida]ADB32029.1 transcriptional regulator, XRE family [Kribbella flavida DSM 17836]
MPSDGSRRGSDDVQGTGFGDLLRRHRRDAGLSQEGLAELAGLSVDAIAALERGRRRAPRPHTLRLLGDALRLGAPDRAQLTAAARRDGDPSRSTLRPPPVPANRLIGRGDELTETGRRLGERVTRLLTLTGPGGVGKTQLALALTGGIGPKFDDGVCWVPLAPIADQAAIAPTIAAATGLHPIEGARLVEEVAEQLGRRRILLVLDNCEHLVAEAARICAALLESCPNLSILATSRELLRVPGESVYVVPPLALPAVEQQPESSPAVRLFVDRASARGNKPTGQIEQVARVVRRLEGMPLAIELAAARTNVLTVEELAAELETSFGILAGVSSTAEPRQQSLADAIGWSHDLLTAPERTLFAELSVFVGGWTLNAAAAVLAGTATPGPLERAQTLDLTSRLVDKSLIRVSREGGIARYDMLAVIREFAAGRLAESGRGDEVARNHAAFFLALAEEAETHLRGANQGAWLDRLEGELDNLRAAMSWALRAKASADAVRLAGALWLFCYLRGHYSEGSEWLERSLVLAEDAPGLRSAKAKAQLGAGMLAFLQCEYEIATTRLKSALAQYEELGDTAGTALVMQRLGCVARERGDYLTAESLHCRSYDLFESLGDRSGMAWAHNQLGFVAWLRGDLEVAARRCRKARDSFRVLGDGEGLAWALISLGAIAQYAGDLTEAEDLLQESLALSQRLGYREGVAWSLNQLGIVERRRGFTERAVHLLDESLAEHRDLGDRWRSASVLEELATVAQQRHRTEYAAFLLGAADGIREVIGAPVPEIEKADHQATRQAIERALDRRAFRAAWSAGRATPLSAVADGYPGPAAAPDRSTRL